MLRHLRRKRKNSIVCIRIKIIHVIFYMLGVMIESFLPYGFLRSNSSLGGSVDNAKDANVSMIKFTLSNRR